MSWLRLLYIGSIAAVALLAMFAPLSTWVGGNRASQAEAAVRKLQLLERDDRWILQLELHNADREPGTFTIGVDVDGRAERSDFDVEAGGDITFIHHVYRNSVGEGRLTLTIERAGTPAPVERVTYYLRSSSNSQPEASDTEPGS